MYHTTTPDDRDVALTGIVAVPKGTPPAGGWPVISWAHGTTGDAATCTPSLDAPGQPEHDYLGPIDPILDEFVKHGYAVVQTDYEGEGVPGVQPYLNGTTEGRDVIDMVRAARQLDPSLSTRWIAMGHSQGGQAALFATSLAPTWAPELQNLGGVAMAPASQLPTFLKNTIAGTKPTPAFAFAAMMIEGAAAADTEIHLDRIFSPSTLSMLPQLHERCGIDLFKADSFGGIVPSTAFRPDADLDALERDVEAFEPGPLAYASPLLLLQGTADTTVSPLGTDALDGQLCENGATVFYEKYAGKGHRPLVPASAPDASAWIAARFAGKPAVSNCGKPPRLHPAT
jgi:pimeloyl-ACP methyl ester carboxylesterase